MKAKRIHKSKFARLRRRVSKLCLLNRFFKYRREVKKRKKNEKRFRNKME